MIDRPQTPALPHHDYETLDLEIDDEAAIVTERYPAPFPDALVAALEADAQNAGTDAYDRPTLEMPLLPEAAAVETVAPKVRAKAARRRKSRG